MKSFKQWVSRFAPKVLDLIVVLAMLLQPVGMSGTLVAVAEDGTTAVVEESTSDSQDESKDESSQDENTEESEENSEEESTPENNPEQESVENENSEPSEEEFAQEPEESVSPENTSDQQPATEENTEVINPEEVSSENTEDSNDSDENKEEENDDSDENSSEEKDQPSEETTTTEENTTDNSTADENTPEITEENPLLEAVDEIILTNPLIEAANQLTQDKEKLEDGKNCLSDDAEIKDNSKDDWNYDKEKSIAETKDDVKLGVKYVFPGNDKVSVTFTCLPSETAKLKIEQIEASKINFPEGVSPAYEYAYDITTDMENGTFKYDITLPKDDGVDADISYIEKSAEDVQKDAISEDDLKKIEKNINENDDSIKAEGIDHFSTYASTTCNKDAKIEVIKKLVPSNDLGKFNLYIGDSEEEKNVGNNGTTGKVTVYAGDHGKTYKIKETAGINTSLSNYDSYISCKDQAGKEIAKGFGAGPLNVKVEKNDDITCTITNTAKQFCGDRIKNGLEQCDGSDLGGLPISDFFCTNKCELELKDAQVRICHATDSHQNPYIENEPNKSGDVSGHDGHNGPIWYPGIADHSWGDIIPPFYYIGGYYPGKNWDEKGQEILKNDCAIKGKLIIEKLVDNNNGGTKIASDFSFSINGGETINFEADGQNEIEVTAGKYTIIETPASGYDVSYENCSDINVSAGETKTCKIKNDDKPGKLIIKKTVINKNGGTKKAKDFSFFINGSEAINFETDGQNEMLVETGTYTITESPVNGYEASYNNCSEIYITSGETKTCEIINNDQPATLTLIKTVTNNNGGTKKVSDFILKIDRSVVISGVPKQVSAGLHIASEINLPGYSASAWGGDCAADGKITLAPGENKTCTINNDDQSGKLIVKKIVKNNNGGNKIASDFSFSINGGEAINFEADGQNEIFVSAGKYNVIENSADGYKTTYCNCSNIFVKNGETKICTITNYDQPGTITLIKKVINDNGGTKKVSDFILKIDEINVISGIPKQVPAGIHTVSEVNLPGYEASSWGGDCAADGKITLAPGENKICEITNNDKPAHLIVIKNVENNNGGTAFPKDFIMKINGIEAQGGNSFPGEETGTDKIVTPGRYYVSESGSKGYEDKYSKDCFGSIELGQTKTCVVTNSDKPAMLFIRKHVINDDGGNLSAHNFTINVTGANVSDTSFQGLDNLMFKKVFLDAGEYSVDEIENPGYAKTLGENCSGTIANGETKFCTITNNDVAPTLTVKKHVVNDNGGTAIISDFGIKIKGFFFSYPLSFNDGTVNETTTTYVATPNVTANKYYYLSENDLFGYAEGKWSCYLEGDDANADENKDEYIGEDEKKMFIQPESIKSGKIFLKPGQNMTCEITNNDIAPKFTLVKQVEGTDLSADNWILSATGTIETPTNLSGTTPVISDEKFMADTYTLTEASELKGFTTDGWNCVKNNEKPINSESIALAVGDVATCTIINTFEKPRLLIDKSVGEIGHSSLSGQLPGNTVRYILRVTAPGPDEDNGNKSNVNNVMVTDLTPAGFVYVPGSWKASSNFDSEHIGLVPKLTHIYASPGVWSLGNMQPGEVITLEYDAKINDTQDAGFYPDLAYAEGEDLLENRIIANEGVNGVFVDTEVEVITPNQRDAEVALASVIKTKKKTDTNHKTRYVLGTSTTLPNTGASPIAAGIAIIILIIGFNLFVEGRKRMKKYQSTVMKSLIAILIAGSIFAFSFESAKAADNNIAVKIEKPIPTMYGDFKIGFVTLEIGGDELLNAQCFQSPDKPIATEYTPQPGGNSGDCIVDASTLTDGNYDFYVVADNGTNSATSDKTTIKVNVVAPGTPVNYDRDDDSCTVSFKTAADMGGTVAVELYRSTSLSFVANSSTFVIDTPIGSDTAGTITDPNGNCGDYYYAIRAINSEGNWSGFIGDEKVTTKTKTEQKTKTRTITTYPEVSAAIQTEEGIVAGESTTEGNKENQTSPNNEDGQVLGESTENPSEESSSKKGWLWTASIIILAAIIYGITRRKKKGYPTENQ